MKDIQELDIDFFDAEALQVCRMMGRLGRCARPYRRDGVEGRGHWANEYCRQDQRHFFRGYNYNSDPTEVVRILLDKIIS